MSSPSPAIARETPALILIADDDRLARRMLQLLLQNEGYRSMIVESGDDALERARELKPDLLLLDVNMPGIDGYEVCRRIRRERDLAEMPIMMITALTDREARLLGLEAGADDFISKPFDLVELAARLRTVTRLNRYRRLQEGDRLAEQMEMAAAVQHLLLPSVPPSLPGLEIVGRYTPATHVGGDYYDFVVHDGMLYFLVADVSGHGVASALFMAGVRSAVRSLLPLISDVVSLAQSVNVRMFEDAGDSGMFLSATIGCYAPQSGTVSIINCGHPEPVVVRRSGELELVPATAPPLGIVEELDAQLYRLDLGIGDVLCLHTDGLIEATSPAGDQFGVPRFYEQLRGSAGLPLPQAADTLVDAVTSFHGGSLEDDVTLVLIRRTEPAGA